jgi:hypothetical protein
VEHGVGLDGVEEENDEVRCQKGKNPVGRVQLSRAGKYQLDDATRVKNRNEGEN